MSVIIALKNKEKTILAVDNNCNEYGVKYPIKYQKEYKIQKFRNFVIAYKGEYKDFVKLVDIFHFNNFPTSLTLSYLLRNFYPKYLDFLVKNSLVKMTDNVINKFLFSLMFFDGNNVFDVCNEGIVKAYDCNITGEDEAAFSTYDFFKDKLEPKELAKKMFDETTKVYSDTSYPLIYCEDLDKVVIIEKDGTTYEEKLINNWEED